ncbi:MAG: sulfur carrier protein ThiS [Gammaproteobacteria bacterium]
MRILVNGSAQEVADGSRLGELLALLELRGRIAVEVNGELVPRSAHATQALVEGDRVEIVQAIGGGEAVPNPGAASPFVAGAATHSGTST